MSKSPAFQFYPDDFMGGKPGMMTPEQTHVYVWLLCLDWNQGGFLFDVPTLARWCRVTPAIFRRAWSVVQECFSSKEGRWFNERLEKERQKQAEWREKSAKGGRTKRQPPLQPNENHSADLVDSNDEPNTQPKGNTPVSCLQLPTPVTTAVPSEPASSSSPQLVEAFDRLPVEYHADLTRLLNAVSSRESWLAEICVSLDGMHGKALTPDQLGRAIRDYSANGEPPNMRLFRGYLRDAAKPPPTGDGLLRVQPGRGRPTALDKQTAILHDMLHDPH